jgi:predicted DNA-binding transcriptional regulator AlpA
VSVDTITLEAPSQTDPGQLLTPRQVVALLAVDLRTLQYWRSCNKGPAFLRLGAKMVRYRRADIDEFLRSLSK